MNYHTELLLNQFRHKALLCEAKQRHLAAIARSGKRHTVRLNQLVQLYRLSLAWFGDRLVEAGQRLQEQGQLTQLDKALTP
jgi:hypothetical protein